MIAYLESSKDTHSRVLPERLSQPFQISLEDQTIISQLFTWFFVLGKLGISGGFLELFAVPKHHGASDTMGLLWLFHTAITIYLLGFYRLRLLSSSDQSLNWHTDIDSVTSFMGSAPWL